MINLKYTIGALLSLPLLPILYFQGKKIRKTIPKLPEATGIEGVTKNNIGESSDFTLLTLGESTIAGVGVHTHKEGFTGTLAQALSIELSVNLKWKVYACSGYTAKDTAQKLIPNISENTVDLIVIGLGANDAFALHTPWKWRKSVSNLIVELKKKYPITPIVFCNMPPIKEFPAFPSLMQFIIGNLVEILGAELKRLVTKYDDVYYNHDTITFKNWIQRLEIEAEPADFFSDGIHPSKLTYQTWAKDMARFIMAENVLK